MGKIVFDLALDNVLATLWVAFFAWVLIRLVRWLFPWLAERLSDRMRFYLLPLVPVLQLFTVMVAALSITTFLVESTAENYLAVLAAMGIALALGAEGYVSSLLAGIVAVYERPYRPGDWVQIGDAYGEVKSIGFRKVEMVTPDDTRVILPHNMMLTAPVYNNNDGQPEQLCVADFYLYPDHNAGLVQQILHDVALTSPYLQLKRPIAVIVAEKPWGTHYRLKAYPIDSRDQFHFTTDLTVRGKAALQKIEVGWATAAVMADG